MGVSSTTSVLISPSSLSDSSCVVQATGYQEGPDNIDQICTLFQLSPLASRKRHPAPLLIPYKLIYSPNQKTTRKMLPLYPFLSAPYSFFTWKGSSRQPAQSLPHVVSLTVVTAQWLSFTVFRMWSSLACNVFSSPSQVSEVSLNTLNGPHLSKRHTATHYIEESHSETPGLMKLASSEDLFLMAHLIRHSRVHAMVL